MTQNLKDAPEPDVTQDEFDRMRWQMDGFPKRSSTLVIKAGLASQTVIVETYRPEGHGETVLLQIMDAKNPQRLILRPEVTAAIARQRDSLIALGRSNRAKAAADDRKARGIRPGFMKGKK